MWKNERLPTSVFGRNFLQRKFRTCGNKFKKKMIWTQKNRSPGNDRISSFSSFLIFLMIWMWKNERLPTSDFGPNFLQSKFRACGNKFKKKKIWTQKNGSPGERSKYVLFIVFGLFDNSNMEKMRDFLPQFLDQISCRVSLGHEETHSRKKWFGRRKMGLPETSQIRHFIRFRCFLWYQCEKIRDFLPQFWNQISYRVCPRYDKTFSRKKVFGRRKIGVPETSQIRHFLCFRPFDDINVKK